MKTDNDIRTALLIGFVFVSSASILVFNAYNSFCLIHARPLHEWRIIVRVFAILSFAVLAGTTVLASVVFGSKHFALFSHFDKILTRLPVGICGLALFVFISYTVLTKSYDGQHAFLSISDCAAMFAGPFLCFWVFLFYGRDKQ